MTPGALVRDGVARFRKGVGMLADGDIRGLKHIADVLAGIAAIILVASPIWLTAWLVLSR